MVSAAAAAGTSFCCRGRPVTVLLLTKRSSWCAFEIMWRSLLPARPCCTRGSAAGCCGRGQPECSLLPRPVQIGSNELIGRLAFSGLLHVNRTAVAAMFLLSHPCTALLMAGSGLLSWSAMGLTVGQTLALVRNPVRATGGDSVAIHTR